MDQLLNVKELAAYLKCTEQTVRRYVMANKIPYQKIDRMVRFWLSDIQEWVNSGRKKNTGKKKRCDVSSAVVENTGDTL